MSTHFFFLISILLLGLSFGFGGCASERMSVNEGNTEKISEKVQSSQELSDQGRSLAEKNSHQQSDQAESQEEETPLELADQSSSIQSTAEETKTEKEKSENENSTPSAEEVVKDANEKVAGESNGAPEKKILGDNNHSVSVPFEILELLTEESASPTDGRETTEKENSETSNFPKGSSGQLEGDALIGEKPSFVHPNEGSGSQQIILNNRITGEDSPLEVSVVNKQNPETINSAETTSVGKENAGQNSPRLNHDIDQKSPAIVKSNNKEVTPLNESLQLKKTIGLEDVFSEEVKLFTQKNSSIFLSPSSTQGEESNPIPASSVGFRNVLKENFKNETGSDRQVVLSNPAEGDLTKGDEELHNLFIGNRLNDPLPPPNESENLKLGFIEQVTNTPNQNSDSESKKIALDDLVQSSQNELPTIRSRTARSNSGKQKIYGRVHDFLSARNEIDKISDVNDRGRNYKNLKDWGSNREDLNQSKNLSDSRPKQFNRALEWIMQKGRIRGAD